MAWCARRRRRSSIVPLYCSQIRVSRRYVPYLEPGGAPCPSRNSRRRVGWPGPTGLTATTTGWLGYYVETRDFRATVALWTGLGFEVLPADGTYTVTVVSDGTLQDYCKILREHGLDLLIGDRARPTRPRLLPSRATKFRTVEELVPDRQREAEVDVLRAVELVVDFLGGFVDQEQAAQERGQGQAADDRGPPADPVRELEDDRAQVEDDLAVLARDDLPAAGSPAAAPPRPASRPTASPGRRRPWSRPGWPRSRSPPCPGT